MDRRQLLTGAAAAGALAASSEAYAKDPVGATLDRIARKQERMAARCAESLGLLPAMAGQPAPVESLLGVLGSLITYGQAGSLDEEQQRDPRMQAALWDAAESTAIHLERIVDQVEALSDDELDALHDAVGDNPQIVDEVVALMGQETAALGIDERARGQLLRTVKHTAFDMARGRRAAATRHHVKRFRRLQRRVAEAEDPYALMRPEGEAPEARSSIEHADDEDGRVRKVFGGLLIGLAAVNASVITYGVVGSAGFLVLCMCVGVPMLVCAMLLFCAGVTLLKDDPVPAKAPVPGGML